MPNPDSLATAPRARAVERLDWIDCAKAAAIILVVLYHVGGSMMNRLFPAGDGPASVVWSTVNDVLLHIRMPLFFLAAGMLAHRAVHRTWRELWESRIRVLLWPYVLWSSAFALFSGLAYARNSMGSYALDRVIAIPLLASAYWFLGVLAAFLIVSKLLRGQRWMLLSVTLVLSVAAPLIEEAVAGVVPATAAYSIGKISRYAIWYFLGCFAYPTLARLAVRSPWKVGVLSALGFAFLFVAKHLSFTDHFSLNFLLSVTGLMMAVSASVLASRSAGVRALSRYVGARTMPIYLLHPVVIVLALWGAIVLGGAPWSENQILATVLPPVLTAILVVISLKVYDRLVESPLAWIYRYPFKREMAPRA